MSGWKPIRSVPEFDHNQTRFPLRGMHQGVSCTQCHIKPVFTNVGNKCADCHADIHKRQFGANCEQCHSVKGWQVSVQQINQHQNRFPLLGAHAALDCTSCHKGAATGQFMGLPTQCYSCHAKEYQTTTGPNHVTAGFPTTCEQCHGFNSWSGATFDHLKITGFALTGAHIPLDCTACHVGGKFAGTPATCVGCHLPDFQKTTNPNHMQAGFPQTCQSCHTTAAWQPATFDHNTFTKFPLTGTHATVACTQCHVNGQFAGTPADCASCHMKDFQGTTNPNHAQAGIPTTCATLPQHDFVGQCHLRSQQDWFPVDRCARHDPMHAVSCERQLQPDGNYLRVLPPQGLSGNHQPQSRAGRPAANLRELPHYGVLDQRDLRSQQDRLPADRRARPAAMFAVPHQRKLQPHQHHMRLLPSEGLPGNDRSQPRAGRNAADVRNLPHHGDLGECHFQSLHHRFPADWRARPTASVRSAMSMEITT